MKGRLKQSILGVLIGLMLMPSPSHAQFGGIVFDPKNYSLQLAKKIEEASRWIETVSHYARIYENAVSQLTTLRGVLRNGEQMLGFNREMMTTISSIGRSIRTSFRIKRQLESLIVGRARALKEIDDRLRRGIFDPAADRRDLEDYLRSSIGRTSQDALANMERLERMDNTIARANYDMRKLAERKAESEEHIKEMEEKVEALKNCQTCTEKDRQIQALAVQIYQAEQQVEQTNIEMAKLRQEITERTEAIAEREEARLRFGSQVGTIADGWKKLVEAKRRAAEKIKDGQDGEQ